MTEQELLGLSYNDIYILSTSCQGGEPTTELEYQIFLENSRGRKTSNKAVLYMDPFNVEKIITCLINFNSR